MGAAVGVMSLLLASSISCGEAEPAISDLDAVLTKPVEIEVLAPRSISSWVHVFGLVEAQSRMSLSFRVDGTIERFLVEEGAYVEKVD